jgi:hypothetical protein
LTCAFDKSSLHCYYAPVFFVATLVSWGIVLLNWCSQEFHTPNSWKQSHWTS